MKSVTVLALVGLFAGTLIGVKAMQDVVAAPPPGLACAAPAKPMARLEIIFGMSQPNGVPIADDVWETFLDAEVTPHFPNGFTVVRGAGQWRSGDGRIEKEKSSILIIWHTPTTGSDASVEAIRSAYKTRFNQESVMRVDATSCVSF